MKTTILSSLDTLPYFTLESVRQLLEEESVSKSNINTLIYRWMKTGQVIHLKRGIYMTRRFYELHRADPDFAPMVSAILIPQSYVSLEYILQRKGILTEITYPITAITLKQPRVFENSLGIYTYRHIKEELYQGFTFSEYIGIPIAMASVAKALFDFLYFRPNLLINLTRNYFLAEDLRLNLDEFTDKDKEEFAGFVEMSKSTKMERVLNNLRKTVWRP